MKISLKDVKNFKFNGGEWTLYGKNIFPTLDEQYKINFKFKINGKKYKTRLLVYVYGVGPALVYIDDNGRNRIYSIRHILVQEKRKNKRKK